jgi:hypothetical protein
MHSTYDTNDPLDVDAWHAFGVRLDTRHTPAQGRGKTPLGGPVAAIRARKYLEVIPGAVAGQDGHRDTFRVACKLVKGFGLNDAHTIALMTEWNQRCEPPWSERELAKKVQNARACSDLPDGFLLASGGAA